MKSVFVFVLGFVFVFVILKGKFIDLKLVFLISVFVFVYDLRLGRMEWGPWSSRGTTGWVWSWKKTCLLNGTGSDNGFRPAGRVQA